MIISSPGDFREAARRKLPPFLFHYIDGGAYAEQTLRRNVEDWQDVALRQRVLGGVGEVDVSTRLFDETLSLPV
ncbi:alpha-hydroxy-acid oxidizing protein, partial [Brevundimonas sp.]|uniref:alpha-hydroxy-acid oxidizing protein n=1 Tax=Brevundimonas sp. TaxID=1871086 RepID=UPI003784CC1B